MCGNDSSIDTSDNVLFGRTAVVYLSRDAFLPLGCVVTGATREILDSSRSTLWTTIVLLWQNTCIAHTPRSRFRAHSHGLVWSSLRVFAQHCCRTRYEIYTLVSWDSVGAWQLLPCTVSGGKRIDPGVDTGGCGRVGNMESRACAACAVVPGKASSSWCWSGERWGFKIRRRSQEVKGVRMLCKTFISCVA